MLFIIVIITIIFLSLYYFNMIKITEKFDCPCKSCNAVRGGIEKFTQNISNGCTKCGINKQSTYGMNRFMTNELGLGKWAGYIKGLKDSLINVFYSGYNRKCPMTGKII